MSKWQKVSPDQIKVGDRVRFIDKWSDEDAEYRRAFTVTGEDEQRINGYDRVGYVRTGHTTDRTWYIAKPKKAKPDSELADGHTADMWCDQYIKEVRRNRQLVADTTDLRVKIQETEARLKITYDNLQDAYATVDDQAAEIDKWKTKAVALAKQMRADKRDAEPTRPDEPPVGSFFRVDRTGIEYQRFDGRGDFDYFTLGDLSGDIVDWDEITEPGDTLTMLKLVEATDD